MTNDTITPAVNAAPASAETFDYRFGIGTDHPSLPGHFPGHPLAPGVVLLEQVARALRKWRDQRLARIVEAKFVAPLLPGDHANVRLTAAAAGRVRFEIFRDDTLLARGTIEGAA